VRSSFFVGDRAPTPQEQDLCETWRDWELELLRPRLIVTVGGLALRRMLGATNFTAAIGERFDRGGVTVVPLPHPSGQLAARPANGPGSRALALCTSELGRL
jgi:uracil-DNA glycosylase family 4